MGLMVPEGVNTPAKHRGVSGETGTAHRAIGSLRVTGPAGGGVTAVSALCLLLILGGVAPTTESHPMDVQAGTAAHEKPPSPLNENVGYFTENVGQWPNSSLRYVGSSGPFRIALAEDAILLVATAPGSAADSFPEAGNPFGARLAPAAPVGGVLLRVTFA